MAAKVYVDQDNMDTLDEDQFVEDMSDYSDYSDVDENTVHVQFSKVYIDSLQEIFDKLDIEANSVLRTGKLSVSGEPGDMELLQPLLFSLQAKEEDIPLLLPQMMQTPFFSQLKDDMRLSNMSIIGPDNTLAMGRFRLGVLTDQLIYHFLSSHCCKGPGSRQADAVIETTLKSKYALPNLMLQMQFYAKSPPPMVPCGYTDATDTIHESPFSDDSDSDPVTSSEEELPEMVGKKISQCSDDSKSRNTSTSSGIGLCKSPSLTNGRVSNGVPPAATLGEFPFMRPRSGSCRERKSSVYGVLSPFSPPPQGLRPRGGSGTGSFGLGTVQHDPKKWHVDIPFPKDMLIGMYGDSSYPILHWNPSLKVTFKIGSTRSMVTEIESKHTIITLTVHNTASHNVAFAIRSHKQSTMFHSHIIFPKEGLQLLEPGKEWRKDMDVMGAANSNTTEYVVVDLLVCCLEGEASWNVHRRYAVFKPSDREEHKMVKRLSHGVAIQPGAFTNQQKDLGYTLKQVIFHGLQCVVKNKLDEAEIILTQALQLPLFQRISLKAFLFVCLAVLSNKRRKATNPEHVGQVMRFVGCLDQLVQASELSPNMAMPKMVGLIKQLRKELDPQKVIKSANTNRKKVRRTVQPSAKEVDVVGGDIALDNISLIIPGKAITTPIKVALSTLSHDDLKSSLEQSPWASMLNIISIFCIKCTPPVDRFEVPVIASVELSHSLSPNTPLRLLHSSFMSNWEDITSDPTTEVSVDDKRLTVRTSYSDWLVVASLKMDIKQMMQLAVKSVFIEEPILLQINVYAHMFSGTAHGQISAFITPIEDREKKLDGPAGHKVISFPHSFKAYISQKLRLEFKGHFKPDIDAGQSDLLYNFAVECHQQVIEKKVILTENKTRIDGKLMISSYDASQNVWETIREINLSATNLSSSSLTVPT